MKFENFYNVQQNINEYVRSILGGNVSKENPLLKWVDTAVMRFLAKTSETFNTYTQDDEPTQELKDKIQHIFDFINNLQPNEQTKQLRGNFEQVLSNADKWSALNQKRETKLTNKSEDNLELIYDFGNGYKLVELTTSEQAKREGDLMGHCAGDYNIEVIRNQDRHILSLRDSKNNPHVTIELNGNVIEQVKGKRDRAPLYKYQKMIRQWLSTVPHIEVDGDRNHLGYINLNVVRADDRRAELDDFVEFDVFDPISLKKLKQLQQQQIQKIVNREQIDENTFNHVDIPELQLPKIPEIFNNVSVKSHFNCRINELIDLQNSPRIVGGTFNCDYNQITSLRGGPQEVGGFSAIENELMTLEGGPNIVHDSDYNVTNNNLTSLRGAPESVNGSFICIDNPLKSLEGIPKFIGGSLYLSPDMEDKFSEEYARSVSDIQGEVLYMDAGDL